MDSNDYSNLQLQELYELFTKLNQDNKPDEADVVFKQILIREKTEKRLDLFGDLASRSDRLAAALIDFLIVGIPGVIILVVIYQFINIAEAIGKFGLYFTLIQIAVFQSLFLLINGQLLYKKGQTVGKKFMNLKIVEINNKPLEIQASYGLRYLVPALLPLIPIFGYVLSLVDFLLIFANDRRCIHDHLAGTKVVKIETTDEK